MKRILNVFLVLFLLAIAAGLTGMGLTMAFENEKTVAAYASLDAQSQKLEAELAMSKAVYSKGIEELKQYNSQDDIVDLEADLEKVKADYFAAAKKLEEDIYAGNSDKRIAYLTFDDGPSNQTPALLSLLAEQKIPATFFVLGKPERAEQYKSALEQGHILQNHTYSHALKGGLYDSVDSFINDVKKLDNFLYEQLGVKTRIVRFPGGMAQSGALRGDICSALAKEGYGFVDWSASTMDGMSGKLTAEQAYQNAISQTKLQKTPVYLMHDYSAASLEALPRIIEALREQNFVFLPLFYESAMIKKQ